MGDALYVFSVLSMCFGISAAAGTASYLRTAKSFEWLPAVAATLNGGFMGIAVCGWAHWKWDGKPEPMVMFGACSLAGLGGTEAINFALRVARSHLTRGGPGRE